MAQFREFFRFIHTQMEITRLYKAASLVVQLVKNLPAMQETRVQFLGWEKSPGEENGNPLQYSCLENSMDRGTWRAIVYGVTRVGHDLATKPPPPGCIKEAESGQISNYS